jgi:Ras-related protein Rab-5C
MTLRPSKLVLLGNSNVGKSSIAIKLACGEFDDYKEPTIGAAFLSKIIFYDDFNRVKLEIWDTAGQERYRALAPMYYRGASLAAVVYDVTDRNSFEGAKTWIKELNAHASPDITVALIGNKIDLPHEEHMISSEEGRETAIRLNSLFFETSAKTCDNIESIFITMLKKTYGSKPYIPPYRFTRESSVYLYDDFNMRKKSYCC